MTRNGFTARRHRGRPLYRLPPDVPAQEVHDRLGTAMSDLFAHTLDLVDLSSTTHWSSDPLPPMAAHFDLSVGQVVATVRSEAAREVVEQHGFARTSTGHVLSGEPGERESVTALTRAGTHLWSLGLRAEVTLGYPAPDAIPPAPGQAGVTVPPPAPAPRRHVR
ncbi:hypothetical protein FNQ90_08775 [Streptomyces alkaliphilus]|uniref:Uncharacterized protein n=1 Tax=Streptomyces alkaliphilus TaxID=1472722 RepID=A0A7W3Y1D3_9ACTN|nr:hypothetical protein [Streptomyces alkaliphilus]MBB0244197.1 hypothetical protein [Streptomyces alkaliphilus]